MAAIDVIRTLQRDHGLGDDTALVILADYVDARCNLEDFTNFALDRADPEPTPLEDLVASWDDDDALEAYRRCKKGPDDLEEFKTYLAGWRRVATKTGVCRKCGCHTDPTLDDCERVLRVRGMATGDANDPKAVSADDPALCVDCEDE